MIKYKKKICKSCGKEDYIFSKGRCKYCAMKEGKPAIRKQTEKTKEKKAERRTALNVYFAYHVSRCNRSEHSGKRIPYPTTANICHLFPKSNHRSVQTNLDNCIYLTLEEHTRFDELLSRHDFDKLEKELGNGWGIAKRRMAKLLPFVSENTSLKIRLSEYLEV